MPTRKVRNECSLDNGRPTAMGLPELLRCKAYRHAKYRLFGEQGTTIQPYLRSVSDLRAKSDELVHGALCEQSWCDLEWLPIACRSADVRRPFARHWRGLSFGRKITCYGR